MGGNWRTNPSSSFPKSFSYILPGLGARGSLSCGSLFLVSPSLFAGQVGNIVGSIGNGVSSWFKYLKKKYKFMNILEVKIFSLCSRP